MNTAAQWKIVDQHGDDVMTADAVSRHAARERKTPRQIAEREAALLVNVEAGDDAVFAVEVRGCQQAAATNA